MDITDGDRRRISAAIRRAEAETSGEIVCVLTRNSSDLRGLPVLAAALIALALPWGLVVFTAMPVMRILLLQVAVFLAVLLASCALHKRAGALPLRLRRAMARRVAFEQFAARGIAHTKERTGILIFVSLAERYAHIVADEGIAARVPQARWQGAVDALVAHMREGRIADGFVVAIEACGAVLAENFPRNHADIDELPDRLYVI
jgi:putative membrane protein